MPTLTPTAGVALLLDKSIAGLVVELVDVITVPLDPPSVSALEELPTVKAVLLVRLNVPKVTGVVPDVS